MRHKFNIATYTSQSWAFVLHHSCHWVSSPAVCHHKCVAFMILYVWKHSSCFLTKPGTTQGSRFEVTHDPYRIWCACSPLFVLSRKQDIHTEERRAADHKVPQSKELQVHLYSRLMCVQCVPTAPITINKSNARHSCWHVNSSTLSWHSVSTSQAKHMKVWKCQLSGGVGPVLPKLSKWALILCGQETRFSTENSAEDEAAHDANTRFTGAHKRKVRLKLRG